MQQLQENCSITENCFPPYFTKTPFIYNLNVIYYTSYRLRDAMYDQTYNATFHKKLESIQYNAPLAITSAIGRTSNKKSGLEIIEKEGVTANCVAFLIFSDC